MQAVGVAEVTPELDLKLGRKLKQLLQPGEKVKIKIESINSKNDKDKKRMAAIKRLIEISAHSKLGLYRQEITRADAHDREDLP